MPRILNKSMELITDDLLARLLTFPNVLMTSHQAFLTREALHDIALTTLNNFKAYFESGNMVNQVFYRKDKHRTHNLKSVVHE